MRWRKTRTALKIQLSRYRVELGCRSRLLRKPRRRDTGAGKRPTVNHSFSRGLFFVKLRARFERGRDLLQSSQISEPRSRLDRRSIPVSVLPHVARLKETSHYSERRSVLPFRRDS